MSKRGDWGDKIIVALKSDGIRRHKAWCEYYCDGTCEKLSIKCYGSAFCEHYRTKIKELTAPTESTAEIPHGVIRPLTKPTEITLKEVYRAATYSDKLVGEIVLVKDTPYTYRIVTVVEENIDCFTVISGNEYKKYFKRTAFRERCVYILKSTSPLNAKYEDEL